MMETTKIKYKSVLEKTSTTKLKIMQQFISVKKNIQMKEALPYAIQLVLCYIKGSEYEN